MKNLLLILMTVVSLCGCEKSGSDTSIVPHDTCSVVLSDFKNITWINAEDSVSSFLFADDVCFVNGEAFGLWDLSNCSEVVIYKNTDPSYRYRFQILSIGSGLMNTRTDIRNDFNKGSTDVLYYRF